MSDDSGRSGLSGELLDADAPAEVTVVLVDGTRLRVDISAAEQARLKRTGTDVTNPGRRAWAFVRTPAARAARWALAAAAVAVFGNWLADRYADRQEAHDIKTALITTISRASVQTTDQAFDLVNAGVRSQWRGVDPVVERNRVTAAWKSTEAEIDPLMWRYFDGSAAERHWYEYRQAMYDFLRLSYVDRGSDRAALTHVVRDYLDRYAARELPPPDPDRDPWEVLACPKRHCSERGTWRAHYLWLELTLLGQRGRLSRDLAAAKADNLG